MKYSRSELPRNYDDIQVAMQRYLHMFFYERKKIAKLKWHEKNFIFENMSILRDNQDNLTFDLLNIVEAEDYVMYFLILLFASEDGHINYERDVSDHYGIISDKRKEQYIYRFLIGIEKWGKQLNNTGGDPYLNILSPLYRKKYKELENLYHCDVINQDTFRSKVLYMKSVFFHIMYNARVFFDEKPKNARYEVVIINGFSVYSDIYSYCHVLTRHYYPHMNTNGIGGTLNKYNKVIDIKELPISLLRLVKLYSEFSELTTQTEYILYELENDKYILWLKYGNTGYKQGDHGFRIRSFYKCEQTVDLDKYVGKYPYIIHKDMLTVYI